MDTAEGKVSLLVVGREQDLGGGVGGRGCGAVHEHFPPARGRVVHQVIIELRGRCIEAQEPYHIWMGEVQ